MDLIFYKKRIPLKPLLKILREKEEEYVEMQVAGLSEEMFSGLQDSLIEFSELAGNLDVLEESVKRFLGDRRISGYVNLGDFLIIRNFTVRIQVKVKRHGFSIFQL